MPFVSIANDFLLLDCPHCRRREKFTVLSLRASATQKCPSCRRVIRFHPATLRELFSKLQAMKSQALARRRA